MSVRRFPPPGLSRRLCGPNEQIIGLKYQAIRDHFVIDRHRATLVLCHVTPIMSKSKPIPFSCPSCGAKYHLVAQPSAHHSGELTATLIFEDGPGAAAELARILAAVGDNVRVVLPAIELPEPAPRRLEDVPPPISVALRPHSGPDIIDKDITSGQD